MARNKKKQRAVTATPRAATGGSDGDGGQNYGGGGSGWKNRAGHAMGPRGLVPSAADSSQYLSLHQPLYVPRGYPGGGRGGGGGGGGRGGGGGWGDSAPIATAAASHSFSMREEAINTERFRHGWGAPLRKMAVNFVSAGTLAPQVLLQQPTAPDLEGTRSSPSPSSPSTSSSEDEDEDEGEDEDVLLAGGSQGSDTTPANIDVSKLDLGPAGEEPPLEMMDEEGTLEQQPESAGFFLDQTGDADVDVDPTLCAPTIRAPSPCPSNSSSSSEEIVFVPKSRRAGGALNNTASRQSAEGTHNHPHSVVTPVVSTSTTTFTATATATTTTITTTAAAAATTTTTTTPTHIEPAPTATTTAESAGFIGLDGQSQFDGQRATAGNKRRKPARRRSRAETEDREAIEECIEEVAAQMRAEAAESGSRGGTGPMGCFSAFRELGGSTGRPDDDSSTDSDEARSDSDAVARYRDGGDDDGDDDDDGDGDGDGSSDGDGDGDGGGDGDGDGDDGDDDDDGDSSGDDEAGEDEVLGLARPSQRQEEFAMLADGFGEIIDLEDGLFPMGTRKRDRRKSRQGMPDMAIGPDPRTGQFPSASATADAYDGYDVMNWDRPSKGGKGKGKARLAVPNLDPELAAKYAATWERDRQAKKLRKIQREALRTQGLLGVKAQKTGKVNLSDKYKQGITIRQIKLEISEFMQREHERLSFPPMSANKRKMLHQIASQFDLGSKSVGGGASRSTTVFKTKRTIVPDSAHDASRGGRFTNREDVGGGDAGRKCGGGGEGKSREGMVVGASAPELSATNRGRLMLEKMGYRTGMRLGAEGNNEGIREPIAAVVKISKACLG